MADYPTFVLSKRYPPKVNQATAEKAYDKLLQHPEGLPTAALSECGVYHEYLNYFFQNNLAVFESKIVTIGRKKARLWKIRENPNPVYISDQEYLKIKALAYEYVTEKDSVLEIGDFVEWLKDKIHET